MYTNYVSNTELYKKLIKDAEERLPVANNWLDDASLSEDTGLDEYQFYIHNSGYWLYQLDYQLSELNYCRLFLRNYNYSKFRTSNNPNRVDHLIYTISNYYIRYSGLQDKALHLINAIFHLGVNEKNISEVVVAKNEFVNRTKVTKQYYSFKNELNKHQSIRNSVVHRDFFTDNELHKLKYFYSLNSEEITPELERIRRNKLTDYIKETDQKFEEMFDDIYKKIEPFLESLYEVYLKRCTEFEKRGF